MNPLADGCTCTACTDLRAEIGGDPALVDLYGRKLLRRGWAGRTSEQEQAYLLAHSTWAANGAENLRRFAANRAGDLLDSEGSAA
jgi:hypothetical protein